VHQELGEARKATDYMTLADVYRFPTRHFHFHQRQLTFGEQRDGS
jgi:hypothetical protein